jgi:hypothetical protein
MHRTGYFNFLVKKLYGTASNFGTENSEEPRKIMDELSPNTV